MFDRVRVELGIEHRLTKPNHPWTNGQVERMNRTLKEATVKRYHYESHDQLLTHLQLYNTRKAAFAERLPLDLITRIFVRLYRKCRR